MQISRYIAVLLLVLSPFVASAWEGVTNHRDIELARGDVYPFNSDSVMITGRATESLYVSEIDGWVQSERCDTLFESTYVFPFEWLNREVILRVDAADAPYSVEINGERVAEVSSGSSRVEFNITRQTDEGLNRVALRLNPNSEARALESWRESSALKKSPIGGVRVIAPAKMSVRDIFVRSSASEGVGGSDGALSSTIGVVLKSYNLNIRGSVWRYRLYDAAGELVANGLDSMQLRYRGEDTIYLSTVLKRSEGWRAERPVLHRLDLELQHEGRVSELHRVNLGFRDLRVDSLGVVSVNGEMVDLRVHEVEGEISRNEMLDLINLGINTLLFKAGQGATGASEALDLCDELGLYAIVTAPINSSKTGSEIVVGGNVTNNIAWRDEYVSRLERGYYSVRRHPSVIAYNMASESMNGYNLYEGYLHLKGLREDLPIVNLDGGGEWNGDKLMLKIVKQ